MFYVGAKVFSLACRDIKHSGDPTKISGGAFVLR